MIFRSELASKITIRDPKKKIEKGGEKGEKGGEKGGNKKGEKGGGRMGWNRKSIHEGERSGGEKEGGKGSRESDLRKKGIKDKITSLVCPLLLPLSLLSFPNFFFFLDLSEVRIWYC